MLLTLLRERTRTMHEATERQLGWLLEAPTLAQYRWLLGRFWGFHAAWEPAAEALAARDATAAAALAGRQHLHLLEADLQSLGCSAGEIRALPVCPFAPRPADLAALLGGLYVVEGSTLGGQVITRHLAVSLAVQPGQGASYFAGYGAATGRQWKAFCAQLAELPASSHQRAAAAAVTTFECLHDWLAPQGVPAGEPA